MAADNNNHMEAERLAAATEVVRRETLPTIARTYDESGPASILALACMLADIWLASGFTADEWRKLIILPDALQRHREII